MEILKKMILKILTLSVPIVFFPGAERTLCSFLRELSCMGVAVLLDARTILIFHKVTASAFFWLCWTVRGHFRRFCANLSEFGGGKGCSLSCA